MKSANSIQWFLLDKKVKIIKEYSLFNLVEIQVLDMNKIIIIDKNALKNECEKGTIISLKLLEG